MKPPGVVAKEDWPPDYVSVWQWRQAQLLKIRSDPKMLAGALEYYRTRPVEFIQHWCDTYDPRVAGTGKPAKMPFIFFQRQAELVQFLHYCITEQRSGLMEKCRDAGATWVGCGFSVWLWRFWDGASVGWGSRKEQLVDKIGDPDSIFEKIRMLINGLPPEFLPVGFNRDEHMSYMRVVNPDNSSTITGEAGDNIGRGGRKLIYFKDESAHYDRPEKIEAALSENTNVQIDISSVNGLGNVFHRRRMNGIEWRPGREMPKDKTAVFIIDWRDHPAKTQEWYDEKRKRAIAEGLKHVFAQEVDRDYSASVIGTIIKADWFDSAVDAHLRLGLDVSGGSWFGGLDVADGGGDLNALALRRSILLQSVEDWSDEEDVGATTRRAVVTCVGMDIEVQYDSVGIGAGVKSEANRLKEAGDLGERIKFIAWSAGASPLDGDEHLLTDAMGLPDKQSPLIKDFYANLKAQGWWELRRRFERTHNFVTKGISSPVDQLISIPSDLVGLQDVKRELCQATAKRSTGSMKLVVDKTPEGTRSPNKADAIVMAYWPIPGDSYDFWSL